MDLAIIAPRNVLEGGECLSLERSLRDAETVILRKGKRPEIQA
jgi:hypothetical protein